MQPTSIPSPVEPSAEGRAPKAATAVGRAEVAWLAVIVVLALVLFHGYGNASNADMESRSLFVWIGRQLVARSGDFAHTWVIPLVSLYVVYRQRAAIRQSVGRPAVAGLMLVAAALLLHVLAVRAQQPRVSLLSLAGLLLGVPYALYGAGVARRLVFPCGYLLVGFVSYALVYVSFPLRLLSTALTSWILNGLGIETVRSGTALFSAAGGGFQFEVADPCSGLRSLVVMLALAAPYAYFTLRTRAKQWALFAMAGPLAVLSNTLRIVTIALLAQGFGQEFAIRVYHDFSGYLLFGLSVALLVAVETLIDRTAWGERTRT